MHVPGGQLAERFGAKLVIVCALLWSSLASLLTPLVVHYGGLAGLIVLRFTLGLSQGGFFPSLNVIVSVWVPPKERARITSFIYCGLPVWQSQFKIVFKITFRKEKRLNYYHWIFHQMGLLAGNYLSGYFLHRHPWPWMFYAFGGEGLFFTMCYVNEMKLQRNQCQWQF